MGTMLSAYTARVREALAGAGRNGFTRAAKAAASVLLCGTLLGAIQSEPAAFIQQGAKLVGSGYIGRPSSRALRSRCLPTATPRSWADTATTAGRSGVGLHPQRRRLDTASKLVRQRLHWTRRARHLRRVVGRRQHRDRGRNPTTTRARGVWIFTRSRRRVESASRSAGRGAVPTIAMTVRTRAPRSRCPRTVTLRSWGAPPTQRPASPILLVRCGCGPVSGTTWSQQGLKLTASTIRHPGHLATRSRYPPTAIPLSSAGPATTRVERLTFFTRSSGRCGVSKPVRWSHRRDRRRRARLFVALSGQRQYRGCGRTRRRTTISTVWAWTRSGSTWTQQGPKLIGTGGSLSSRLEAPLAARLRCQPTALPPLSAGGVTITPPERSGSSPKAAASGPSED